ncbi:histidine phosphatase family protein [Bacillus sp. RO3]|nr:histidine phosphatase family protein [Bacillus sp. RO3]
MTVTRLYFVRHAHSVYTPDELTRPLSEKGKRDAEQMTERLLKERIDVVCSSPYRRAVQTVEGLARHLDVEIVMLEEVRERTLSNMPVKDFDEAISSVWADPDFSLEGGESNSAAQKRGVQGIFKMLEEYNGKNIAIGTHGNIMVLIMNYFDGAYDVECWKELEMPDVYCLTFHEKTLRNIKRIEATEKKDRSS